MKRVRHPEKPPLAPSPGPGGSLATRLTWVSIVVVTLALSAVGAGLIVIAERSQRANTVRLQQQSADQVAQRISTFMVHAVDRLGFFLNTVPLANHPPETQRRDLENLLISSLPLFSQIALLDIQGNERIKVSRFHTFLSRDLANQSHQPGFAEAAAGGIHMGSVRFLDNSGLLSVPVAMPVKNLSAEIVGIIVAEVNVTHLWQDVAGIGMGRGGYAYLVDRTGRFVAYHKPARVLQRFGEDMSAMPPVAAFMGRQPGRDNPAGEYRGLEGEPVIGFHAPIQGTRWAVVVEQPTHEAYASIAKMETYLAALVFVCIAAAGGLAFWILRRLIEPIRKLTEVAQRLGTGDFRTELPDVRRRDEVGVLSQAFRKMQGALNDLYDGLRGKVQELEQTQGELKRSEEKFRTLVEQAPFGISLIGADGRYKYTNPQFQNLFGYGTDEVPTGREWFQRAYPDDAYRRTVLLRWMADQKRAGVGEPRQRVFTVTCKDGTRKEIHFRPVLLESGDQLVIYEDISHRRKMEQQLQQAQKFEAIGTLAGGIAHDFNNLLMGIQGRLSLLLANRESHGDDVADISAMEEYVRSATDLTKQLLGLARGGKYEVHPTDLTELVARSATLFGRTKKEIRIHTRFADETLVAEVDRGQIEQVLLNLFVNAWQAMPLGGDLYLGTGLETLDESVCRLHGTQPGRYVKVTVTDTGIGMDPETRERIFDPFFTTKGMGRGTGLGLASAYGIIKNHGGFINVYSEKGVGSTFNIYLPESPRIATREKRAAPSEIRRGTGTVLMVDDEQMILDVGQKMLESLGYRVMVADTGGRALELYREHRERIDVVLLDMIMPDMSGSDVYDGLKRIEPGVKVILSSGYSLNGQAADILERGCNGFLQKPFNLQALSDKLAEVLAGETP